MKSPFSALARRLAPAGLFMCALLFSDRAAQAAEIAQVEFNPGFLHQSDPQQAVDLSLFSKGEYVLPGTYRVDVYVNQNFVEQREVQFIAPAPDASAKPCIRRALLEAAGVLLNVFPALNAAEETQCLDVESAVENAQVAFDLGQQRLNLSIPQIALRQVARGGGAVGLSSKRIEYASQGKRPSSGPVFGPQKRDQYGRVAASAQFQPEQIVSGRPAEMALYLRIRRTRYHFLAQPSHAGGQLRKRWRLEGWHWIARPQACV